MTQDERDERAERDARDAMRKIAMFPRGDGDSSCRGWDFAAERSDVKSHEPKMANGVRHPPPGRGTGEQEAAGPPRAMPKT